ncbi:hypothetical protein GOP47_0007350 [Adiantum capillus-veneris]|uniref:Uncharacterized protein n=1 Tax=Adiantum capillus-veneris TaxID=13818 RepID=A0A9D4V146_ADICA|nr:hypothetical protein GOP47_0007350 [Adiantum capillus-veneris]
MEPIKADSTNGGDEPCTSRVIGLHGSTCEPHADQRVCEGRSERCHLRVYRDGVDSIGEADGLCTSATMERHGRMGEPTRRVCRRGPMGA